MITHHFHRESEGDVPGHGSAETAFRTGGNVSVAARPKVRPRSGVERTGNGASEWPLSFLTVFLEDVIAFGMIQIDFLQALNF